MNFLKVEGDSSHIIPLPGSYLIHRDLPTPAVDSQDRTEYYYHPVTAASCILNIHNLSTNINVPAYLGGTDLKIIAVK